MPRSGEPVERKPRRSKRGNGEGSIYLRKDGRWTAAYFVPKPGGGESRRYVYGRSPEEVETKLVEIRKQVRSGAPLAPAGLTVARYLGEWMEQVAVPRVRPNTARSYRDLIAKYLVPKLGRKRLGQLGARDVRQFLAALAADGATGARGAACGVGRRHAGGDHPAQRGEAGAGATAGEAGAGAVDGRAGQGVAHLDSGSPAARAVRGARSSPQ